MQTIFRAGAPLSLPTSRLARLVAVLQTFLLLFPWLLAGGASAWAADLSTDGAPAPVVVAANVPDAVQTGIPGHVEVLAQGNTSDLEGLPDTSPAVDTAIDANRATAEQLQTLRGIGPAMAARIIAERERQPFASPDDLARRVRGVGARRLRQWQEAGLLVSPRQPGGVQDRAVHGHRGHARSVGARAADTQGTEVRGANAQSIHVQGTQAPAAPVSVGAATAQEAAPARSRSMPAKGARMESRFQSHRADDPSCRAQRRIHQRSRSGKGTQVRRSKAPPLFDDRPLFDCHSIFDERSRLLPRG